jgi:hypothetical protein
MQFRGFALQRLAPLQFAIIEMGLSDFPPGKPEERKKWQELGKPEGAAREQGRE